MIDEKTLQNYVRYLIHKSRKKDGAESKSNNVFVSLDFFLYTKDRRGSGSQIKFDVLLGMKC